MIEWLQRVDPARPFLHVGERVFTYGETTIEVERRSSRRPRLAKPALAPSPIFDVIAGLSSGGVTVVGPTPETTEPVDADLVVYTSGSTGAPKGVRLTIANLAAAAAASAEHLGHGSDDIWLLAMPLHHVGGLSILVRQLYTGGSVILQKGFDPAVFAAEMRGRATMVSAVPTMLARLIEHGPFSGLRAVLVGGGSIPEGLLERAADTGLPVLPTYGMTETFGQVATLLPGSAWEHRVHPLPGVDLRISPEGRIAVRGDQVSAGYVGEPDRMDPWFVTNDLGDLDDDGALRVLGRADTVIVTGGENVSPEMVEAVARDCPGVDDVVVTGVPDEVWGDRVVCVYVGDVSVTDLRSWVANRLPGHMVPKEWHNMDDLPRTPLGKPDRRRLTDLLSG